MFFINSFVKIIIAISGKDEFIADDRGSRGSVCMAALDEAFNLLNP